MCLCHVYNSKRAGGQNSSGIRSLSGGGEAEVVEVPNLLLMQYLIYYSYLASSGTRNFSGGGEAYFTKYEEDDVSRLISKYEVSRRSKVCLTSTK